MANEAARKLRKALTPQEVKLWAKLRELRALNFHFRRQSPLAPYIVDFECRKARLVVEVDGGQHNFDPGIRADTERDTNLKARGYRVLRFWNHDVDRNIEGVMTEILNALRGC